MEFEEFQRIVNQEPQLAASLSRAAAGVRPGQGAMRTFDPVSTAAGLGALVILFPVVNRIVCRIGLPWLAVVERYAELWRRQFEQWIDEQYKQRGFDPQKARAASEALLKDLQETTDSETRSAWQRLLDVFKKDAS